MRDSKLKIENDQLRRDIENLETKYTETKQQNETLLNTLRNLKTNAAEDTSVGPNEVHVEIFKLNGDETFNYQIRFS